MMLISHHQLIIIIMRVEVSLTGRHPYNGMVDPLCGVLLPVHVSVSCPRLAGQYHHLVQVKVKAPAPG